MAITVALLALVSSASIDEPVGASIHQNSSPNESASLTPVTCELHVWPAAKMGSLGEGWILNNVEGQALRTSKVSVAAPLPPEKQIALLSSVDLVEMVGQKSSRVEFHPDPPPWRSAAATHVRRTTSGNACYAELTIEKIFYHYSPLMKSELRVLVTLDQFGDSDVAKSTFSTWGESPLIAFPPKAEADIDRSYIDLHESFVTAVKSFARHLHGRTSVKK